MGELLKMQITRPNPPTAPPLISSYLAGLGCVPGIWDLETPLKGLSRSARAEKRRP